jgi:hypothetical protein
MTRMERKTWTTADKSAWGPGPWQDEPDKEQFSDEATGLPCLILRNRRGALCGYVGVTEGHPWFKQGCEDIRINGVRAVVHSGDGVTYTDFCQEGPEAETICHVPAPGEPDRVWWLGFHCAGTWDISPGDDARMLRDYGELIRMGDEEYRTVGYVRDQCALLALQAQASAVGVSAINQSA